MSRPHTRSVTANRLGSGFGDAAAWVAAGVAWGVGRCFVRAWRCRCPTPRRSCRSPAHRSQKCRCTTCTSGRCSPSSRHRRPRWRRRPACLAGRWCRARPGRSPRRGHFRRRGWRGRPPAASRHHRERPCRQRPSPRPSCRLRPRPSCRLRRRPSRRRPRPWRPGPRPSRRRRPSSSCGRSPMTPSMASRPAPSRARRRVPSLPTTPAPSLRMTPALPRWSPRSGMTPRLSTRSWNTWSANVCDRLFSEPVVVSPPYSCEPEKCEPSRTRPVNFAFDAYVLPANENATPFTARPAVS
jgi:hypothetical protein